jgi:putative PIN family toxin of toxin-antitoxin system
VWLVVNTNVLIGALLVEAPLSAHLIVLWREGRFDLLTSAEQLDELMRVTRYPKIRERLAPALVGRLINELRGTAVVLKNLPAVTVCRTATTTIYWQWPLRVRRIFS